MKSLALAVLLVSCACQASGGIVANSARAGVEAVRRSALVTLDVAEIAILYPGVKIAQGIAISHEFCMNALVLCQNRVDGTAALHHRHANLMRDSDDDGILMTQLTRALDQHVDEMCAEIDATAEDTEDTENAENAQQIVLSVGGAIGRGIDDVVAARAAGRQSTHERYVCCINVAQRALSVPLAVTSLGVGLSHGLASMGTYLGLLATRHGFNAGRAVVNKVADGASSAIDEALGTEPPQQMERDHAHED